MVYAYYRSDGITPDIQLMVAPVFLTLGISLIIAMLIRRQVRNGDRILAMEFNRLHGCELVQTNGQDEMITLAQQACITQWAIGLCAGSAILIYVAIATQLIGSIAGLEMSVASAALIIMAMASLAAGLMCFLRVVALDLDGIYSCRANGR